jgi:hypothetical protein
MSSPLENVEMVAELRKLLNARQERYNRLMSRLICGPVNAEIVAEFTQVQKEISDLVERMYRLLKGEDGQT